MRSRSGASSCCPHGEPGGFGGHAFALRSLVVTVDEEAQAAEVFGTALPAARRYADLLAGDGIAFGLLGPREAERIWTRHVLNSAALVGLIPSGAAVVDVGSGAGLPGIPLALARPDLRIALVESLQRRVEFLERAVRVSGLDDRVTVVRGRAEDPAIRRTCGGVDVVVARAVAPLDRLTAWCLPLLRPGGTMLALKGATAASELQEHRRSMTVAGAAAMELIELATVGASGSAVSDERVDTGQLVRVVAVRRGK